MTPPGISERLSQFFLCGTTGRCYSDARHPLEQSQQPRGDPLSGKPAANQAERAQAEQSQRSGLGNDLDGERA